MIDKQNLHTHTMYCDASDTPEQMVEAAIAKGFDSIGFSGHSYMSYASWVPLDRTLEYKAHINRLKKQYDDRIKIYLGLEVDMYSGPETDLTGFDYLIGGVHELKQGDKFLTTDGSASAVQKVVEQHFGGNGLAFAKAYYEALSQLPKYGRFDIIAHFDLITKYLDTTPLFDEGAKLYRGYAIEAARALAGKIPFFEVNTGAIARGYRTTPYPAPFIIEELRELDFGAVITSDCHDCNQLDMWFDEAAELLRSCGFKERFVLTDNGFVPVAL